MKDLKIKLGINYNNQQHHHFIEVQVTCNKGIIYSNKNKVELWEVEQIQDLEWEIQDLEFSLLQIKVFSCKIINIYTRMYQQLNKELFRKMPCNTSQEDIIYLI